ncbi:MAG TPA: 3-deoxy-7-phosphoheptulonate synthase [Candidatus Xenobia bacterium]|jgi:3-deoxy-7-phosphoheptulonate synthase
MVIVLKDGASDADVASITSMVTENGWRVNVSRGEEKTIVGVIGIPPQEKATFKDHLLALGLVQDVVYVSSPYKLVSRHFKPEPTVVQVGPVRTGGGAPFVVMAGPCAVESKAQLLETAHAVKEAGAAVLRGGAYKPRTSPYSFQGLREEGLQLLAEARTQTGLPVITEVTETKYLPLVSQYADILQIGTRNMASFDLLKDSAATGRPVFLKRGMAATIEEFMLSAEYLMAAGNANVILCERGIRTFETSTRNTLDLSAIPVVKEISHLPIYADPSHGTGKASLVRPMALAALVAGADGLQIEVHPHPEKALSDGQQSLNFKRFGELMREIADLCAYLGRPLARVTTNAVATAADGRG